MKQKKFIERIYPELSALKKKDAVRFAGICALRALPMLGAMGHVSYWKAEERQLYLYAVFYAIDCNLSACHPVFSSFRHTFPSAAGLITSAIQTADGVYDRASSAYDVHTAFAAHPATRANPDAADIADCIVHSSALSSVAAGAGAAAALAARCALFCAHSADNATVDAVAASCSLIKATEVAGVEAGFPHILLTDIEHLKTGKPILYTGTKRYGAIWANFRKALEHEGCAWWYRLYERLFADGFEPDLASLKQRMSLSPEIRGEGARAVADAMEQKDREGRRRR
jgi:hypothetical protein